MLRCAIDHAKDEEDDEAGHKLKVEDLYDFGVEDYQLF